MPTYIHMLFVRFVSSVSLSLFLSTDITRILLLKPRKEKQTRDFQLLIIYWLNWSIFSFCEKSRWQFYFFVRFLFFVIICLFSVIHSFIHLQTSSVSFFVFVLYICRKFFVFTLNTCKCIYTLYMQTYAFFFWCEK